MTFQSILFVSASDRRDENAVATPDFFADLFLDQIVAAVTHDKEEYRLGPLYAMPLKTVDAVRYRQEVFQDLEDASLLEALNRFACDMHEVRFRLQQLRERYYEHQNERWVLDAVLLYGDAVRRLHRDLSNGAIRSRGFSSIRNYLRDYTASKEFEALVAESVRLSERLSAIRYCIYIRGLHVEVHPFAGQADYGEEVRSTFERFQQGNVQDYTFKFAASPEMNQIEGQILDGVAHLHQELFSDLVRFRQDHEASFLDQVIAAFDREVQFYIAFLDHAAKFKRCGLEFCYPEVDTAVKAVVSEEAFDLALADKLRRENAVPVCNDLSLVGSERIIVVSGPNQGGKTTFARSFGQLHYLASLGCPVPGTRARLFLPDRIFTHFEREERMVSHRGKLEDDLVRVHEILASASPQSIVIVNEMFSSTALRDAVFLSSEIVTALAALDLLCVWVTFIDEIASLSETTVSMVSTVVPEDPAARTFKIVRRPADGLAYAMSIAEKHRLTYKMLKARTGA